MSMHINIYSNDKYAVAVQREGRICKYMSFDCVETADIRGNRSTADCSLASRLFSRTIELSGFNLEDLLVIEISSLESLMPMN